MEFSLSTQFRVVLVALWWTAGTPKKLKFRVTVAARRLRPGRKATGMRAPFAAIQSEFRYVCAR
jgi:hypothetical protein